MTLLVCIFLFLAMIGHSSSSTYCVCKDGVGEEALQGALDYACGHGADCSAIQPNGACFNPNTVKDHCTYAVNSYFQNSHQVAGSCYFSGAATISDKVLLLDLKPFQLVDSDTFHEISSRLSFMEICTGTTPSTGTPGTTPSTVTPGTTPTTGTPGTFPTIGTPGTSTAFGPSGSNGTNVPNHGVAASRNINSIFLALFITLCIFLTLDFKF
ncbi:hypothetical protein HRI_002012900 [Hibiscus trionum]|uniref:X8 domain-containing protein n=1 Tax=Hibiscus trionum TaxID=183268 RepID=A0A9W7M0U0_HIBTR|nr:hypothetical protein HRI_002012900 [Hibiscus trionum]